MIHLLTFTLALLVCSLLEFGVHWTLHRPRLFRRWHAKHHAQDTSWWWPLEAVGIYLPMASPFLLLTPWMGWGWAAGACCYCCVLPWSHAKAHAGKDIPWQTQPIHVLHHQLPGWRGNYGITTSFWDIVFRTRYDV